MTMKIAVGIGVSIKGSVFDLVSEKSGKVVDELIICADVFNDDLHMRR